MLQFIALLLIMTLQLQAEGNRGNKLVEMSAQAVSYALSNKPKINQELKAELLKMREEDQSRRKAHLSDEVMEIDRMHNPRLKEIIQNYGWPGINLVGLTGTNAMWLLVQHQDEDVPFQKECLLLLKDAVERQDAAFREYAYLFDRVCLNENLPQIYGTQWIQKNGKQMLYPVEDFEHLNQRRFQAGLCSIEEYKQQFQAAFNLNDSDFE